jgi:hypothetical protein
VCEIGAWVAIAPRSARRAFGGGRREGDRRRRPRVCKAQAEAAGGRWEQATGVQTMQVDAEGRALWSDESSPPGTGGRRRRPSSFMLE